MDEAQRVVVSGRVQQVGYRDWMMRKARDLGVRGWVRNWSDGRVEMVAAGPREALSAFVDASHEGPRLARIEQVDAQPTDEKILGRGFNKRFTLHV